MLNIDTLSYDNDVVLDINYRARGISTTFNGGAMPNISRVIHHHVSDGFDLKEEYSKLAAKFGLNLNEAIIFITAADVRKAHIMHECQCNGVRAVVSLTAGFTNPYIISAGEIHSLMDTRRSTVNIAVFVDRRLNRGALVDAVRVVSEAKAVSLFELTGGIMHGTTSDAVAVIANSSGMAESFSGPITPVGRSITMAVFKALSDAVKLKNISP
ncbi:MAG: adenosylcobinamide amidohydrolase [Nitrososphaerota archaeon]|jgi:adenosylcobinamide amidohydrolase|nr:adenosylcobinamide amidohydrolase [Nitrososphaerota archaeon]MDG6927961.1 adenosylcobinamide amidohydrolase [Nitrososphaerota archaeon]MDG6929630.1 adenosylcobinamide amidohydrolase [Nitrososphaerota archaeon]MDG6932861.1 adenosylcobinamide amidohydrolase [Nitrososphaerota archaeon]MDG6936816.1 adenosylcobinamide amidohydrolase [Nitrososphaerota archaeon]